MMIRLLDEIDSNQLRGEVASLAIESNRDFYDVFKLDDLELKNYIEKLILFDRGEFPYPVVCCEGEQVLGFYTAYSSAEIPVRQLMSLSMIGKEVFGLGERLKTFSSKVPSIKLDNYYYLSRIASSSKHRSRGVGAKLLEHCEDSARDRGLSGVVMHVLKSNDLALPFYLKRGYKIVIDTENRDNYVIIKKDF